MKKARAAQADAPRPPCACGAPGEFHIELNARKLVLERDSGIRAEPYWSPSYKTMVVSIQTIVCAGCYTRCVNVSVAISATVEKAAAKP